MILGHDKGTEKGFKGGNFWEIYLYMSHIIMAENQRLLIEISASSFCYKMNAFELLTYQDKVCNVLALECDITPHKGYCIDLYYFL